MNGAHAIRPMAQWLRGLRYAAGQVLGLRD